MKESYRIEADPGTKCVNLVVPNFYAMSGYKGAHLQSEHFHSLSLLSAMRLYLELKKALKDLEPK